MWMSLPVSRSFPAAYTKQPEFLIHVFMGSRFTNADTTPVKENAHGAMTDNPVELMVDFLDVLADFLLLSMIVCLGIFLVVIISVWKDSHMIKEPSKAKFRLIFVNESIRH